ncbi:hypothetical protein Poly59_48070 [Rubripirellula reticaptiva]|uniref:Glycoamylase-like domain-containing protein n=1 Tax=Rubripirellula reticaptiva TaxID=2528013 RepID=A0A5C6EDZ5_9BACT|nr:hypothetical protein Poly59_48070 [Rubripirellula reticaptiva]
MESPVKRSKSAVSRRTFLAGGIAIPLVASGLFPGSSLADPVVRSNLNSTGSGKPDGDSNEEFLTDLQRRCYQYFIETADPSTGFIPDRAAANGSAASDVASSAACGFGLTAHSIAARKGWVARAETLQRTRQLLHSLVHLAEHKSGFVYHFFGCRDGARMLGSEASSIDTALMIAGAMCAQVTFADDHEVIELADQLYRRVDWTWMLGDNDCLHMGWTPEAGMLPYQWDTFSELVILVLLAIGAPNHAIPPRCWQAWNRGRALHFQGESFLSYPPLFVHQYPMAYFDFRRLRSPSGRSYWDNSVRAHHAQIAFMSELSNRNPKNFAHYGADLWGLTSSDSVNGYRDWGGPYEDDRYEPDRGIDGTVVPSAAGGGLAIVPQQSLYTLRHQRDQFADKIYGRYGFVNAYNPATGWIGTDVIGIDTGITLAMADNLESGGVWQAFMAHPAATRALQLAGFTSTA